MKREADAAEDHARPCRRPQADDVGARPVGILLDDDVLALRRGEVTATTVGEIAIWLFAVCRISRGQRGGWLFWRRRWRCRFLRVGVRGDEQHRQDLLHGRNMARRTRRVNAPRPVAAWHNADSTPRDCDRLV